MKPPAVKTQLLEAASRRERDGERICQGAKEWKEEILGFPVNSTASFHLKKKMLQGNPQSLQSHRTALYSPAPAQAGF